MIRCPTASGGARPADLRAERGSSRGAWTADVLRPDVRRGRYPSPGAPASDVGDAVGQTRTALWNGIASMSEYLTGSPLVEAWSTLPLPA